VYFKLYHYLRVQGSGRADGPEPGCGPAAGPAAARAAARAPPDFASARFPQRVYLAEGRRPRLPPSPGPRRCAMADHPADPTAPLPAALPEQFGPYHILRRLGQGGMGTVYLARDSRLDRLVALK